MDFAGAIFPFEDLKSSPNQLKPSIQKFRVSCYEKGNVEIMQHYDHGTDTLAFCFRLQENDTRSSDTKKCGLIVVNLA